jgi:hypothetical protein
MSKFIGFNESLSKKFQKKSFKCAIQKVVIKQFFQMCPKVSNCTEIGSTENLSSVPQGQKVATLNLEISPSSVLLYKESKNCAKKKGQKEVQIVPL